MTAVPDIATPVEAESSGAIGLAADAQALDAGGLSMGVGAQTWNSAPPCPSGFVDVIVAQAKKDEEIIGKMRAAVMAGDKEEVFELAMELTCAEDGKSLD